MFFFALLLALVSSGFSISQYEKFLIQERWLPPTKDFDWDGISSQCKNDTLRWVQGLAEFAAEFDLCIVKKSPLCTNETKKALKTNFYALKQLDAFGRLPPGILDLDLTQYGSEQECKEVSKHFVYKTHYCYVYSSFSHNESSCAGTSGASPISVKTAVCMPASCSEKEIPVIMTRLKGDLLLNHCSAQCVPEKGHTNTFFWIFISFMGILITVCILASLVDFARETYYGKAAKTARNPGLKVLLSFSFYTNGASILDTTPAREGHLKSLDCIRFFSMLWVVEGHVAGMFGGNDNLTPMLTIMKPIMADTIGSAFFSVDTFFVLSGMLVSYMFFKQMSKNRKLVKNPITWVLFYVHRYLRLTPPCMLFICFYIAMVPVLLIGSNSMMLNVQESVAICEKSWWRNLLYINNFDAANSCYGITWYLAADTQMYVVAPIFLIALFYNHWIGLIVIIAAVAGSVGITFYEVFHYNLPGNFMRAMGSEGNLFYEKLYGPPWIRITPYLVGLYAGYLLALYPKNKRPNIHWIFPILGWMATVAMALACVYGPHDYLDFDIKWSNFVSAFYYSFSRIGWAIFVCWVVVANFYGWGGPIASFMDHPLWQPLGRLSYTAYLVHFFMISYFINLFDRPLHFTTFLAQFQTFTIPIAVMSYCFAFFWSCLCEIPFGNLEKMAIDGLIESRKRKPEEKPKLEENWEVEKGTEDLKL